MTYSTALVNAQPVAAYMCQMEVKRFASWPFPSSPVDGHDAVMAMSSSRKGWSELRTGARLFRIAHGVWGAFNLLALAWIVRSAVVRRRDVAVYASTALLLTEGAALVVGRGNCPFGPFQARLGDPVPMFEWVLPPRAAKAAVPVLAVVSIGALGSLLLRPPRFAP